jgi:hypothetical protein
MRRAAELEKKDELPERPTIQIKADYQDRTRL